MDILTIARERQSALRVEIAEIDGFIRMAEGLLESAMPRIGPRPERPEWTDSAAKNDEAERIENAEISEQAESAESAAQAESAESAAQAESAKKSESAKHSESAEQAENADQADSADQAESPGRETPAAEVTDPGQLVRRFPWSNAQPPARSTGADDTSGPTRRNLMRRQAS